jgi:predicted metal-dependent phosphoesterase TrpH
VRIDLHTHSTASDGTDSPAELMAAARAIGLDVIALTDHDSTGGWERATAALPAGLTLLRGAEISCRLGANDRVPLHLLAYLFDPAEPEFAAERVLLRDDRRRRAERIVERCRALGAPITWEQVLRIADGGVVGRPHVATALVDAGVVGSVDAAFSANWLADGGRAYVDKYALDAFRAVRLVRAAGGVPVIAHPRAASRGRVVTDEQIAELAAAGLGGVEADHAQHEPADAKALHVLADDLGLVATGSSDYHGSRKRIPLAAHTTSPEAYEAIVAMATGVPPLTAGG